MPPGNIAASACTRQIGSSGVNQRSPSAPQMARARSVASSPATRARSAEPSRRWEWRASSVRTVIGAIVARMRAGR